MVNLGLMSFQGRGRLQDFVDGYAWLARAAAAGLPGVSDIRDQLAERMTPEQIQRATRLARGEALPEE